MCNFNLVCRSGRHFLLLVCLLAVWIGGTAVAADENTQKPQKSAPTKPRRSGPYCGLYCIYTAMKLAGQKPDFRELVKPEYLSSRRGSSLANLKKAAEDNGLMGVSL